MGYLETDNLNLQHLLAELKRLDLMIWREMRRWQGAKQNPDDALLKLWLAQSETVVPDELPLGGNWGRYVANDPVDEVTYNIVQTEIAREAQAIVDAAHEAGQVTQLDYLQWAFRLDAFEVGALLICAAPLLDVRYGRFYDSLQDEGYTRRATVNLVINLLTLPGPARLWPIAYFGAEGSLIKHHLLQPWPDPTRLAPDLLSQIFIPDRTIVAYLLGRYEPRSEFEDHLIISQPQLTDDDSLLAVALPMGPDHLLESHAILVFCGPDQVSQEAAVRQLAAQTDRRVLTVDLAAVMQNGLTPLQALRLALRDARLTTAIPCLQGWDAYLVEGAVPPIILRELIAYPDLVVICGRQRWQPQGLDRNRNFFWVEAAPPGYQQRQALWTALVQRAAPDTNLELTTLASQFSLTGGQIRDAVASAQDRATQRGDNLQLEDLFVAARIHSRPKLSDLARQIIPRYTWDDIVLPEHQREILSEIVSTIRERAKVLEGWGVGQKLVPSAAVTILFAGPPGTGKTMAAEVIAGDLGFDLYKINLSSVVSKYIGETEKNLERIFQEAENSNTILFFDEADALFGKRSQVRDAHDRHANIEISYLLQRMESFDGVTILATNLQANLDEAFLRRLHFVLSIPFPKAKARHHIWQTLFPPEVPRAPDLDFGLMAERFKLAGGNIRNIIVSATYLAAADGGQVTMAHLLHGTRRELHKMGRLVNETDLQWSNNQ